MTPPTCGCKIHLHHSRLETCNFQRCPHEDAIIHCPLHASAPELLEATKDYLADLDDLGTWTKERLQQAIAKAEAQR